MNYSKILMSASALVLALLGLPCIFAPDLVLVRLAGTATPAAGLLVQITGALYLGFAAINWMGKNSLIGGIYGRPVAIGNLMHFLVAALALLKAAPSQPDPLAWPVAVLYGLLAAAFGFIVFRNPVRSSDSRIA
jgi:hypothetical protein